MICVLLLFVGIGGGLGSILRYLVSVFLEAGIFPSFFQSAHSW